MQNFHTLKLTSFDVSWHLNIVFLFLFCAMVQCTGQILGVGEVIPPVMARLRGIPYLGVIPPGDGKAEGDPPTWG